MMQLKSGSRFGAMQRYQNKVMKNAHNWEIYLRPNDILLYERSDSIAHTIQETVKWKQ
jgi:hypothetical protein